MQSDTFWADSVHSNFHTLCLVTLTHFLYIVNGAMWEVRRVTSLVTNDYQGIGLLSNVSIEMFQVCTSCVPLVSKI